MEEPDRVRAALGDPDFVAVFGSISAFEHLKRVPPGFPADGSMADLLRYKDVIFMRHLSNDEVLSPSLPEILADDAMWAGWPPKEVPIEKAVTRELVIEDVDPADTDDELWE